jgi:hypothetical protein
VIVVVGAISGMIAVLVITVGVCSLVRRRIPACDPATWKEPRKFGSFAVTLGISLLLTSMTIIAVDFGWSWPRWALGGCCLLPARPAQVMRPKGGPNPSRPTLTAACQAVHVAGASVAITNVDERG